VNLPQNLLPDYRFLAVIGHPIEHSLSPLMHNTAFQKSGLHYVYVAYDIEAESLASAVRDLKENGFVGFNVTIPHKRGIVELLDELDYESKHLGAVNTVAIEEEKLIGYNTDVHGILKSLEFYKERISSRDVLILGAGGAARAVVYSLDKYFKPQRIVISARSIHKANAIFSDLGINGAVVSFPPSQSSDHGFALVVNTTPLGMFPDSEVSPIPDKSFFRRDQIVFDLIYRPLETTFLKLAREAGALTISGLEMFLQQGAKSFEIWTGERMPLEDVRQALLTALGKQ